MRISAIVPVRNEENSIAALLDGLISQSLAPDEIVITDGGSTDATVSIVETYIKRGAPIRLVHGGPAFPGRGRNLAASQASGEWLAFIDAGVKPEARWLESLSRRANQDGVDVVYGSYQPITDTFFRECAAMAYVSPPEEVGGSFMRTRFIACSLMRRTVWESVGGFPEYLRSGEDLLFMKSVDEAGFAVTFEPQAMVGWNLQPTPWRTFKRFVTYARNNIRAGLWQQWQAPVFKRYALLAISALPSLVLGYGWLIVTLVLWFLMLTARALISIWRNRHCCPAGPVRNLLRLVVLIPLIAILDLATFVGSIQFLVKDFSMGKGETRVGDGS
jgi:glycosyltransferase involved in cell wall biosynthesis